MLEACKYELVKLQQGDAENLAIWRECVELTSAGLQKIYARLGISFDHWLGESFYNDAPRPRWWRNCSPAAWRANQRRRGLRLFRRRLAGRAGSLPDQPRRRLARHPAIVRKSDGGFLYATTDLATIDYRVQRMEGGRNLVCRRRPAAAPFPPGVRRRPPLGQTPRAGPHRLRLASSATDGKMFKTRSGENVGLAEVLEEAVERAARRDRGQKPGAAGRGESRDRRASSASAP